MTDKKLAIDADGTIFRTMSLVCGLVNIKKGTNYTYKDITSWDFWKKEGLEKEFWEVYDLMDNSDLRLNLRPYDLDTVDVLKSISLIIKQPLDILTCNHEKAAQSIKDWFVSWKNRSPEVNVICIGRADSKEKLELPYDIYIDDSPHMADIIKDYPDKQMILMNAPWNKEIKNTNQINRAENWNEVYMLIYNHIYDN